jgi:hypothetical protein
MVEVATGLLSAWIHCLLAKTDDLPLRCNAVLHEGEQFGLGDFVSVKYFADFCREMNFLL